MEEDSVLYKRYITGDDLTYGTGVYTEPLQNEFAGEVNAGYVEQDMEHSVLTNKTPAHVSNSKVNEEIVKEDTNTCVPPQSVQPNRKPDEQEEQEELYNEGFESAKFSNIQEGDIPSDSNSDEDVNCSEPSNKNAPNHNGDDNTKTPLLLHPPLPPEANILPAYKLLGVSAKHVLWIALSGLPTIIVVCLAGYGYARLPWTREGVGVSNGTFGEKNFYFNRITMFWFDDVMRTVEYAIVYCCYFVVIYDGPLEGSFYCAREKAVHEDFFLCV